MKLDRQTFRIGTAVISCAILFRLLSGGVLGSVVHAMSQPEMASFLLYMETGRIIRAPEPEIPTEYTVPTEPTAPIEPPSTEDTTPPTEPEPAQEVAVFSQADAALVKVNNFSDCEADVAALLEKPLSWDLTQEEPTVLILHTHGSESYTKTEDYEESGNYRTLDENYNMVSIGNAVADILEAGGISVLHDQTLHDYPSYDGSYNLARKTLSDYLSQYPSIQLVLDLHRDAATDANGRQIGYTVSTTDGEAAKLMLVVGTNSGGLTHPNWQENMALAVKLHAQLEKVQPGICRPISLREQRFNQDQSQGAVLVEVGAAGNTRQEALLSAEILAKSILDLAHGTAS